MKYVYVYGVCVFSLPNSSLHSRRVPSAYVPSLLGICLLMNVHTYFNFTAHHPLCHSFPFLRTCTFPLSSSNSFPSTFSPPSPISPRPDSVTKSPGLSLRFSFCRVKGHTWNYCAEGGRAWERGQFLNLHLGEALCNNCLFNAPLRVVHKHTIL